MGGAVGPGPALGGAVGPGPTQRGVAGPGPTQRGEVGPGPTQRGAVGPRPAQRAVTDAVYLRVLEDLRAQIRDGVLGPGARVPSRNGIIAKYGVGETAAKHALGVLAAEGLIETRAGSGSYVRAVPATRSLDHGQPDVPWSPFGLPDAQAVSWRHQTEQRSADRPTARLLGLAEGDPVVRTRYLISADGSPVQLVTSYEPARL